MKDHTFLATIIDDSGSMSDQINVTKNSFKEFIQEQRKLGDNVDVQITYFNSTATTKNIQSIVDNPNVNDYTCGGTTAIYETLGTRITEIGEYLKNLPEADRPDKVIIAIITDGENNVLKAGGYTQLSVKEMIQHQETKYNWKFIFLGADLSVASQGANLGIRDVITYAGDTKSAYAQLSNYTRIARGR